MSYYNMTNVTRHLFYNGLFRQKLSSFGRARQPDKFGLNYLIKS
jgi:hypothetical protein